jgi:hypothetical protein
MSIKLNDEGGKVINVQCAEAVAFLEGDALELAGRVAHALDFVSQRTVVNVSAVLVIDETNLNAKVHCWAGVHTG